MSECLNYVECQSEATKGVFCEPCLEKYLAEEMMQTTKPCELCDKRIPKQGNHRWCPSHSKVIRDMRQRNYMRARRDGLVVDKNFSTERPCLVCGKLVSGYKLYCPEHRTQEAKEKRSNL